MDVFAVGLVENHQHVLGDRVEELGEFGLPHRGAGGVVRVADEHHAGAVGDCRGERLQVVGLLAQRDVDRGRPGKTGQQRVRLEGPPGVDDFRPRLGGGFQQLLEEAHGSCAERHVLFGDVEAAGEGSGQLGCRGIGVAVEVCRGVRDGLAHRGQRTERALVGGEFR